LDTASQSGSILDLNSSAAWTSLQGQLNGLQAGDPCDYDRIDALVNNQNVGTGCTTAYGSNGFTNRVIVPAVVSPATGITIGQWTRVGYLDFEFVLQSGVNVLQGVGAIITGGLSGGEPASTVPSPTVVTNDQTTDGSGTQPVTGSAGGGDTSSPAPGNAPVNSSAISVSGADPINLVTGDFTYNHTDLTVGTAAFPYGLGFTRTYDSSTRYLQSPVGWGWTHNFLITAQQQSDGFAGMALVQIAGRHTLPAH
jgi:hypothetical protein